MSSAAAPQPPVTEQSDLQGLRTARDGHRYAFDEFEQWYGHNEAFRRWCEAGVATEHTAGHDTEPPANTVPDRQLSLVPILLRRENIETLKACENKVHRSRRSLHRLARDTLNNITLAGHDTNLEDQWFLWRSYVACHDNAVLIIGTGVTKATAEFIEGTTDPNRGGQQRLDFVIYRSDGTYCRLHPGSTKRNDAQPLVFDSRATQPAATDAVSQRVASSSNDSPTVSIPVEARSQWSMYPEMPFTYEDALRVPQQDRVGKYEAFRLLQDTPHGVLRDMWWLFVSNIGRLTQEVIGNGITQAELCHTWPGGVELLFRRADASEVRLQIIEHSRGRYNTRIG